MKTGHTCMSKPIVLSDGTKCWSGPNCKKHSASTKTTSSSFSSLYPKNVLDNASLEDLVTTKCLQYAVLLADQWGSRQVAVTYMVQADGTKHPIHVYGVKDKKTVGDVHGEQPLPHDNDFLRTEVIDAKKAVTVYGNFYV